MLVLVLVCAILVLLLILAAVDAKKPHGYPPGPSWFPLIGCYPQFRVLLQKLGYCHLVWSNLTERFGPLVGLRLGKDRIVVVSGYEAVKHVSSREDCDGRPDGFFFQVRTFDQRLGVVFVDGEFWKEQRKFATRHLRNLGLSGNALENIILQEVDALVKVLNQKCSSQTTDLEIDLHNLFDISILNSLWAVVAGRRFELGDSTLLKIFEIQHASFRALDMSGGLINQMPFLRFVAPEKSGFNTIMTTINTNYGFLRETLTEHKQNFMKGNHSDLIDAYLDEIESKQGASGSVNFHDLQLLAMCMDLFMAGSETTSNTLSSIMIKFLEHPEMQSRVQEEIDAAAGRERLPNSSDKLDLPYLEAMIMEAQRLFSVAPVAVPHRTMKDCDVLGHKIPKDTTLLLSIWSVHMDPEHWKDPEVFRPERFLNETQDAIVKDDWFIPFGLGKRRCLGETLARQSLMLFLGGLLQNFSFEMTPSGLKDKSPYDGVTLAPRPFKGIIRPRGCIYE